jgi:putative DNA primase/helicase
MTTFTEFAACRGLDIDEPIADGRLHRVPTEDDKSGKKSGVYVFHGAHGACWNWKLGGETEYWNADTDDGLPVNPSERKVEAKRREYEQFNKQADAARKAARMLERSTPTDGSHPYLKSKQVKAHGLTRIGAVLLIPLSDVSGQLLTLQTIGSGGSKKFVGGGKAKGASCVIGELLEGEKALLCEGWATGASLHEATGLPVICAMNCGNLKEVAGQFAQKHELLVCADDDYRAEQNKGSNPGIEKATKTAEDYKLRIAIPHFTERGEGTDFNDLHVARGLDEVALQIKQAWQGKPEKYPLDEIAARLAKLSLEKAAEEYKHWQDYFGLTKTEIKEQVAKHRGQGKASDKGAEKKLEPWPDPVEGGELLDELANEFLRFLVLPEHGDTILAAWCLHTYCFEQFDYSPILHVTSPVKQCGKSHVLDVMEKLASNPKKTSSMNGPTMFRIIDARRPTLLLDEMDRISGEKKEMITVVLNGGYYRDGTVDRCVGDEHQVREFAIYCPKALVGIGEYVSETVVDRSIRLPMQKKLKAQEVEKFRRYQPEELRRKCLRWVKDNLDILASCRPAMPGILSDRQEDIWEGLFAIAEAAGGNWPQRTWDASVMQAAGTAEDVTDDLVLLDGLRRFLDENPTEKLPSSEVCEWLNRQEDWRKSKGMDQRLLSRKLKPFGINPRNINTGEGKRPKGYLREDVEALFSRYLPPLTPPL